MRAYSTTTKLENRVKQLPEDTVKEVHKILNAYILKSHNKNINIMSKRLYNKFNKYIDKDIVDKLVGDIYKWMWLHYDTVLSFNETDNLQRLFNSLAYHLTTLNNAGKLIVRQDHTEIIDDLVEDIPLVEELHYTVEDLDWQIPNEERLEYHKMALDELKEYLQDNPQSDLNKALEVQKKKGEMAYLVALHYAATPSYTFIRDNAKAK